MEAVSRRGSIRLKLIAAFMLVSVLPMLVATELATRLVVSTFESNLQVWLYETSRFFFGSVLDERREVVGIADSLIQQGLVVPLAEGRQKTVPASLQRLMDALGYDLIAIYDEAMNPVFSNREVTRPSEAPVSSDASLYTVQVNGRVMLMAGAVVPFDAGGKSYNLMLGIFVDENYISNINALKSFDIRLYYRQGDQLAEYYSSSEGALTPRPLPPAVISALQANAPYVFRTAAEGGDTVGVYTPLMSGSGTLLGVIFCGLRTDEGLAAWVNRTNIFIAIMLLGSMLAIMAAFVIAQQVTRPLTRLAAGVRAVAAGDFQHQVAIRGQDEVAEVSEAFNRMTRELARLKEVEEKLRRRERLSTLGEVAAGLAHEVRNPLGIIKTTAELLQLSAALDDTEKRRLGYVVEEVRRIEALIRDFLSFAKAPQVTTPIRPRDIVERALAFTQQEAEKRRVSLTFEDGAPDATILGDPGQIYDAVLNLVLNALDALPAGGHLRISQAVRGRSLMMTFADDGPGVPEDIVPRVFDPFVTGRPAGTGLGLAKVFAVMESHGGRVVYRGSGAGAVFELSFPLAE
ncbi:ATP-binding protein [uncultured Alsobacter sp.]|uniref:ATP-binding protein n=1 Tax=uncultured Alsobacter sp. TaxID=1748258 RepID=UPI0025D71985|nr:ATP-binding protein [uncultured Alsobacter sp.]